MSSPANRSKAVVADYKQRKLNRSALNRIQELLHVFEQDRLFDRKIARTGMLLLLVLVAISLFWFASADITMLR